MALDLVIFGSDGTPEEAVALELEAHHTLMLAASQIGSTSLLSRLIDYYSDAAYQPAEVELLKAELLSVEWACALLASLERSGHDS